MKTTFPQKITLLGASLLLPLSASHADTIVYEQNFDTTGTWYVNESVSSPANSPNGWWSNDLSQADPFIDRGARISDGLASTGHGNTLNLYSQNGSTKAEEQASYSFSETVTQGSFEFAVRAPSYNSVYVYFGEKGVPTFDNFYLTISASTVSLNAGSPTNDKISAQPWGGSSHSSTDFYVFKITFDESSEAVSVFLDGAASPIISMESGIVSAGILTGTIEGMESGTYEMGRVGFNGPYGGGYSSIHIDDIVLTSIPEPSCAALLCGSVALLGLLLRRRCR
ncbi:hypothetical protein H5P28_16555 [Ruficoccus amylovorans]|uniref:PEP-CTERM sorting domain-containing protein n=1 Tax=Ruficoccus amylovorans TaxID=1804625 RepID=A0A842HK67_9BACT|nr:hypothetical protein [Ruficoccus amylovorans]MBC2595877.1 hypothetical protein [Ruficoccus amylovorans]